MNNLFRSALRNTNWSFTIFNDCMVFEEEDCICVYKFNKEIGPFEYDVLRNGFIPYQPNSIY